ncbi:hypothetical protein [Vagococcus fessus]|uniref:Rad50/SbcC-type AAA domain-containing protein n=1 Tax=Vagococcus fessus TaxID=120370 RepID=A0A430ABT6_9ENTE|nr:hypothetical protein [Vagococcus fessus]RSU04662.1 hypothetical protein CBF31_01190 [Vagococcus fessus]
MLLVNNLAIKIITESKDFYFNEVFKEGVNIIASEQNTSGKSSIISGIMYCLGMEEIIGGKGSKVLSAAFNNKIKDTHDMVYSVLKAELYLEISNGNEIITILRTVNDNTRHDNLVTIIESDYLEINNPESKRSDFYVHDANSARGEYGFFNFLENFLNLKLPNVLGYDGKEKKLYLQNIFSAMIIEQKRGWSDILARVPNFGIKDSKKKTIEYLLDTDSIELSKKRLVLKSSLETKKAKWMQVFIEANEYFKLLKFDLKGVTEKANYIESNEINIIDTETEMNIENLTCKLRKEKESISSLKYSEIYENEELSMELTETIKAIDECIAINKELISKKNQEKLEKNKVSNALDILRNDIQNNKDLNKVKQYGAEHSVNFYENICPTCSQTINDSLIVSQNQSRVMTPEQNIKHLKNQEVLFESILIQKERIIKDIERTVIQNQDKIENLSKLAKAIKSDLFNLNGEYNENVLLRKINLDKRLAEIEEASKKLNSYRKKFVNISNEIRQKESELLEIGKEVFSDKDNQKLSALKSFFVTNLGLFGYKSINVEGNINISKETLLPEIMGYDLKFDSSASDHIRGIWAYTIALQQVSENYGGNHLNFLIFDEPGQHSIIEADMESFLEKINSLKNVQTIVGLTMKDSDSVELMKKSEKSGTNIIYISDLAFS